MKRITILTILLFSMISMYSQDLKITEIMYNPANSDNAWEWVEIYNAGIETIDLSGYVIDDNSGAAYTEANIETGILESGKSAIFFNASVRTEEQFRLAWGTVDLIPVSRWSALNNGGDSIGIWDSFDSYSGDNTTQLNTVEQVTYDDAGDWPVDDGIASIYLADIDLDNNLGASWALSVEGATTPLFDAYTFTAFGNNQGADIGSPGVPISTDTENPVISCPDDVTRSTDEDSCDASFPIEKPTATDNVSADFIFEGIRNDAFELTDPFPKGETEITWTATDAAGNTSESCVQKVTVNDEVPPVISCSENISVISSNGSPLVLEIVPATATDNCMGEVTISRLRSDEKEIEAPYPVGETTIVWQAVDETNNAVMCSQIITVNFNGSMQNDITVFSIPGQSGETGIDLTNKTVLITVPFGTEINALVPTIGVSADATVSPANGVVQNFTNPVTYTVTAGDGAMAEWIVTIKEEPESEPEHLAITDFTLVNADTDEDIFTITEGMLIDINTLPTLHLDIRANTTDDVESVRLSLNGAQSTERTESLLPYALYRDLPIGDYLGNDFIVGAYAVTAVPYSIDGLGGDLGMPLTVNFELIDGDPACESLTADVEVVNPTTCNGSDSKITVIPSGGTPPYEVGWISFSFTGDTVEGLTAGTYVANIYDANGCNIRVDVEIEDPKLPEVTLETFSDVFNTATAFELSGGMPEGGSYSGDGVTDGMFDPSIGLGTYEITYTYIDEGTGCENTATEAVTVLSTSVLSIESFTLINADTNEDLFLIEEGMLIDINTLPTVHLDIRANTTEDVESVRLSLSGAQSTERTESLVPYALYQDLPIGNYKGNDFIIGIYAVNAVPYSLNSTKGNMGIPLTINFELFNSSSEPELSVTEFILVNADTNEDLFPIVEGMVIDINSLPTLHLDIRANTTDDVESVRLSLSGAQSTERTESLVPYALYQDLPIGDYKGNDFIVGSYVVKAVPYSKNSLKGDMGSSLTVGFELIDPISSIVLKEGNAMGISPNPSNGIANLNFKTAVELLTVSVFDLQGRLVRTFEDIGRSNTKTFTLGLEGLYSGNYIIIARDTKGNVYQKQMVVKRQ